MAAFNPDQYYPNPPGGPFLGGATPRVQHTNFDTTQVIADRIRNKTEYQGCNELQMQGYIQDEINYAHTNAIGLRTDGGIDGVNRNSSTYDGHGL